MSTENEASAFAEESEAGKLAELLDSDINDDDDDDLDTLDRGDSLEPPKEEESDDEEETSSEGEEESSGEDDESDDPDDDADDEDADDEDADPVEEEEEEEKAPTPKKDEEQGIPRWRFNEVNERAKAAEAQLARLRAEEEAEAKAEKAQYDFDASETEYMELLLDGDTSGALDKRKEIDAARKAEWKAESVQEAGLTADEKASQAEIASLAHQAEELYPVFDQNHEDFDPLITTKVKQFYSGYLASPSEDIKSRGDALVAAMVDVIQLYGLDARYGHGEGAKNPEPEPKPKKAIKKTKQKIDVQKQQAPPTGSAGEGAGTGGVGDIDIENMSDDELDALPEATLARLRGDII